MASPGVSCVTLLCIILHGIPCSILHRNTSPPNTPRHLLKYQLQLVGDLDRAVHHAVAKV